MSNMNRREILQAGLSVITAAGLHGEVKTLNVNDPQAIVLMFPQKLTREQHRRISEEWHKTFKGNPIADVPVIALDGGADIKVVDRKDA